MNNYWKGWFYFNILLPTLWRFVLAFSSTIIFALLAFWTGVPENVDRAAMHWKMEAINRGWPVEWDVALYRFFYFVAWVLFIIGWVISSYLTVFLVRWLIF